MKWLSIKKSDLILIGLLVAVCAVILIALNLFAKTGDKVTVYFDGEIIQTHPLNENKTFLIETGEDGEFQNEISITDGKVTVTSANCRDLVCVKHHAIEKEGESIICLPHKLVVAITDKG